ncbi:hypothetical protein [uncultured Acidaminococcus sp.]|uniref:hypothetical protein n=1 Tax=uncultured Acidaminococcus sp. TaxID=352152 RepID=UPI002601F73C|nr:hypothetical protein [uncultured Acidaminococcus sp.]
MDGSAKKATVFVLSLLLLGAAIPGQACREPHMLDGPRSVYAPPVLSNREVRSQLRTALACRSQWDLVQNRKGPVQFAVTEMDGDGQVEILAVSLEEGSLQGHEVRAGKGKMEKIPQDRLEGLLRSCPKPPVWFTIYPEHRESWLEGPPSHNIHMFLDSYEIHVGRKEGFG